jgi:hypothetical protein
MLLKRTGMHEKGGIVSRVDLCRVGDSRTWRAEIRGRRRIGGSHF